MPENEKPVMPENEKPVIHTTEISEESMKERIELIKLLFSMTPDERRQVLTEFEKKRRTLSPV